MSIIKHTPLFIFIFILYNVVVIAGDGTLTSVLVRVPLLSRTDWPFTTSDLLLALSLIALYGELVKATSSSNASILDHSFSVLVFVAFLVEFIAYRPAGTSTFFLMTLMSFVDVVAGFTVTIAASRRDFGHN